MDTLRNSFKNRYPNPGTTTHSPEQAGQPAADDLLEILPISNNPQASSVSKACTAPRKLVTYVRVLATRGENKVIAQPHRLPRILAYCEGACICRAMLTCHSVSWVCGRRSGRVCVRLRVLRGCPR
jgi:hypothetical protein